MTEDLKNIESFTKLFKELSESFQNFAESSREISQIERIRNEIFEIILQKLKNRHSETFKNHRESFHSIIFSSFSETNMTEQHANCSDRMQKMMQKMLMNMLSNLIQQSVITAVNVVTNRSNSSSTSKHSQLISRTTSESRAKRWITSDIEFFDSMYENKSALTKEFIEHAEKNIYFRNVHFFLERVKNVAKWRMWCK